MGDGDDPATEPVSAGRRATSTASASARCSELPVEPGSVIFTKSGGIHGIRNQQHDEPLRFVAFLYHTVLSKAH